MRTRLSFLGILAIAAVLIVSSMVFVNVAGQEPVDHDLEFVDPSGDAEGTIVNDQQTEDNADILKITSAKVEGNIVLTMKVKGSINTTNSATYQNGYQFNIDIDGDQLYDWLVTSSYMGNYGGTDSQLQEDDRGSTWPKVYYLDNATGIGTDTLRVQFPITYITDMESIDSWDMYATSSSVKLSNYASYVDTAPDEGFTGGSSGLDPTGDEDSDGMPNGWESDNGLDPYDPTDADDDDDADGYTNLEEYTAGTDPQDKSSKPTEPGVELKVNIIKPAAGEEIPPGEMNDKYIIKGTATVPPGDSIDLMDFRVVGATVNDWQPVYDDSGASDYSKWYGEIDTYTVSGQCAMMNKGDNTLEVRATTVNGKTTTAKVVFKFNPDGGGEVPDDLDKFALATPTDTSITVTITSAKWDVDIDGNKVYINYFVKGTTSGVDHCKLTSVNYYDDGTFDDDVDWMEEMNFDGLEVDTMKLELYHFESTSDNWQTWEYVMKGEMSFDDYNESGGDSGGKELDKIVVYVRAYSDTSNKDWNQASKSISVSGGGDDDDDDDDDGSPGFESVIFMAAIAVTVVFVATRRRRR